MADIVTEPFGGIFTEFSQGRLYCVTYDENAYLALPAERQEFCMETWAKKGLALECDTLVLRLIPDDFFPMHGHDKPYIHAQVPIAGGKVEMFRSKTKCYVELTGAWAKLPEHEALAVRQQAREVGQRSGCDSWEVWYGHSQKLDSGWNTPRGQSGVGRG